MKVPTSIRVRIRDEIAQEDASFSLVNNAREARILAAIALGDLVGNGSAEAILAIIAGYVAGNRRPAQAEWLIVDAKAALARFSVEFRAPKSVQTTITAPTLNKALGEEVGSIGVNEWEKVVTSLDGVRTEAQSFAKSTATQVSSALTELERQMKYMREETQILWWLFGGHSKLLLRGFSNFDHQQAALVGAVDLATLTTASKLGPIAAPAILERVIGLSKKSRAQTSRTLLATIESFDPADLVALKLHTQLPHRLTPVTTAIDLARTLGSGAWHARFKTLTGIDATIEFEPLALSEQLYREHLLGQLK